MTTLFRGKIVMLFLIVCCPLVAEVKAGWINEIHYDNDGADTGEFVEIVLAPGEVKDDFSLEFYNGSNGTSYSTTPIGNPVAIVNGFSIFSIFEAGIQNGSPDGVALIKTGVPVVQFLSYEGSFTATDGAANGMTSTDIGVSEPSTTPIGDSLQLIGMGSVYSDFTWTGPTAGSSGAVNVGQTLIPEPTSLVLAFLGALLAVSTLRRRRAIVPS